MTRGSGHLAVLAALALLPCCRGGSLSKTEYEGRVCSAMIRGGTAFVSTQSAAGAAVTYAEIADDLGDMTPPEEVRQEHEELVSELKLFAKTLDGGGLRAIDHLSAWIKALSEIRAKGYDVKPGWGDCPAG